MNGSPLDTYRGVERGMVAVVAVALGFGPGSISGPNALQSRFSKRTMLLVEVPIDDGTAARRILLFQQDSSYGWGPAGSPRIASIDIQMLRCVPMGPMECRKARSTPRSIPRSTPRYAD
jgi:hypothetical protein